MTSSTAAGAETPPAVVAFVAAGHPDADFIGNDPPNDGNTYVPLDGNDAGATLWIIDNNGNGIRDRDEQGGPPNSSAPGTPAPKIPGVQPTTYPDDFVGPIQPDTERPPPKVNPGTPSPVEDQIDGKSRQAYLEEDYIPRVETVARLKAILSDPDAELTPQMRRYLEQQLAMNEEILQLQAGKLGISNEEMQAHVAAAQQHQQFDGVDEAELENTVWAGIKAGLIEGAKQAGDLALSESPVGVVYDLGKAISGVNPVTGADESGVADRLANAAGALPGMTTAVKAAAGIGAVVGLIKKTDDLVDAAADAGKAVDDVPVPAPKGATFVSAPNGKVVRVPEGWVARTADNGKGIAYQRPGASGNADMIRIMDPTPQYPNGYMRYYSSHGQPLDVLGKPGPNSATHIPLDYQGQLPAWPK